ncbi:MAG TPA: hypothetical protein PLO62_05435 [Candidatus Hydrogenedentes bacterium]|nr:hypothetical protein [Candidatus Hydrogenedentota bacterium]
MRALLGAGMLVLAATIAQGQMPPVTGGAAASLADLIGKDTLVTVVLKERGVEDPNLRVVGVESDYFSVLNADGERNSYRLGAVQEVRIQGGAVESKKFVLDEGRALSAEQKQAVIRSRERAAEIFQASSEKQEVKMEAAVLMALGGDKAATDYLKQLVQSNDSGTALQAVLRLYLAGDPDPGQAVVLSALSSGNRRVKSMAADVCGLLRIGAVEYDLMIMFKDRSDEYVAPATRALARIDVRGIVPTALERLSDLNANKAEASIFALSTMGGDDIKAQLKTLLNSADQMTRFRIARVLYALDDPMGESLLQNEILGVPSLELEAALILARDGNVRAARVLRDRLQQRFNPDEPTLLLRSKMAIALVKGGDRAMISTLQGLLRSNIAAVEQDVCQRIAPLGMRTLLTILQPSIESSNPMVALAACQACAATGDSNFRERLVAAWVSQSDVKRPE